MDIGAWLRKLGLEQYEPTFRDNDIEAEMLPQLTPDDLSALGVTSVGHRRKLLNAIAALTPKEGVLLAGAKGAALDAAPAGRSASDRAIDDAPAHQRAERRQLTVMFIDLVGSTELSQRLDPEDMRAVIFAYHQAVSREIARYDGRVAKLMGDGVLAYFGWPRAHEDDAERAVRAGLAAASATASLRATDGKKLAARVGIATGLVVVGDLIGEGAAKEEAVVGDTPNLAARLQALAEPGWVVIAKATKRLVAGLFVAIDLGERELKGFSSSVRSWRIVGEATAESRFAARHGELGPLVGREAELVFLLELWKRATSGKGQAQLLSGEAGIGKSRLVAALAERLGAEPHVELRYFCSPFHVNSALHPVITQLERAAGFVSDDSSDRRLDKLEALLGRIGMANKESLRLLAALLSIDAPGRLVPPKLPAPTMRARTLVELARQVEAAAAVGPVAVLVEDAHWIDPTTAEWLGMLIERLAELPALLIVTARPEFEPRWKDLSHVPVMPLGRLEADESAAIIERVAGGKKLPLEIAEQIVSNTEGVPLFVEELTKAVLDSGLLVEANDRYLSHGPLPALVIPSTLQDSLMARLDRLASVKETAQISACIGRVFDHRLLAAVSDLSQTKLEQALQQLEQAELVFRSGRASEATYTFKHALVRDTAYQSLLKSRRQHIHGRIAAELEAKFADIGDNEPETVAQHHTLAGQASQAVPWWLKAGQRALKSFAHREAAFHLAKGLELVETLPVSEERLKERLLLQTAMGSALIPAKGWGDPEVLHAFSTARTLAERLGDKAQLFAAVRGESACRTISGDLRAAETLALQCHALGMELAEATGDSAYMLEAHHQLWGANFYLGNYSASEIHANHGMAIYDYDRHRHLAWGYTGHDPGVCCRAFSAQMLCICGNPDQAVTRSREMMALAERDAHPFTMAQALSSFSVVRLMRREFVEARDWAEKGVALCSELVIPLVLGQARAYLGWALVGEGQVDDGIREMREGIEIIAGTGADMGSACYLCALAQACGAKGEAEEGLAVLDRAFAAIVRSDSVYQLPELLRTKAEILLLLDPADEAAEGWLHRSLVAAREQGARSSELRAALRLAELFSNHGRYTEAREILGPVHAGFREGLDTPDLVEARNLLQRLPAINDRTAIGGETPTRRTKCSGENVSVSWSVSRWCRRVGWPRRLSSLSCGPNGIRPTTFRNSSTSMKGRPASR